MDWKSLLGAVVRHGLTVGAGALATHGVIGGNQTETVVSAGMVVAGVAWSVWDKVGRAAVLAELDIARAKVEAWTRERQAKAAALRNPNQQKGA